MSLQTRLASLITAIGADIKILNKRTAPPSYITSAVVNPFDPQFSVYNWKPSNTHQLRTDLIKAAYGNAKCEIVAIGDSWGAGCTYGSTPTFLFDRQAAFPISMRKELALRGIPEGGTGLVRINDDALTQDPRWAFTGAGWTHTGKFYSFTGTINNSATFTTDMAGTKFILTYVDHNDSATFTVSVDGATTGAGFSGTITNNGGSVSVKQLVLTTTINVNSTIVIKRTNATGATYLDIIGGQVVDDTRGGLLVHNIAQSGATATGTGSGAWVDSSAITSLGYLTTVFNKITAGATANPHLIIELGANDHPVTSGNDGTHALISAITAAITTLRGKTTGDCILVMSGQLNDTIVPQANWEAYLNAMYVLADTLDVPLFDSYAKMGNYSQCVADGWVTDGGGHWAAPAYKYIGHMMAGVMGAEFGNVPTPQVVSVPTGTATDTTLANGTVVVKYTP